MSRSKIVVKLGGELAGDEAQLSALGEDLATIDASIIVMHGGGPQASELSERLGIERQIVGGRRITDRETLDVMKMILGGLVNVNITATLRGKGLQSVGLSGVSSGLIQAVKRPPRVVSGGGPDPIDFGHVGDIVGVNVELLELLLGAGYVPVLNSLGGDDDGNVFNINADIAASKVAAAVAADHLLLVTGGVPGVLRDKDDPSTRIPRLTATDAREAIADGVIVGGMIPKIEEALAVLDDGVGAIHILGSIGVGDIRRALEEPGSVGTVLVAAG